MLDGKFQYLLPMLTVTDAQYVEGSSQREVPMQ